MNHLKKNGPHKGKKRKINHKNKLLKNNGRDPILLIEDIGDLYQ